jgi:ligand-binding sensor domain-containing protein
LKGSVWVGTDNGIGIFNCGDIASDPCNAYLPIVNNNGFNGYLFQKETVNCISIDGANRKWIGTNNGAWLLSEDGLTIIHHFTKSNSPLPSDTIMQILIHPKSGEVFINTNNQMVSYRGTATAGKEVQNTIQIFPNPVSSNYNGSIAIRGLVNNAIVKITDISGRLLYQTNALGGQALWNARTIEGQKLASGIYLVFVRDLTGNEKAVGKIVIADGY